MRTTISAIVALMAWAASSLSAAPAQAQSVAEFYKGRNVTMIIGGSPGGGFDTLARGIARHLNKHIPGNPNIVPRNHGFQDRFQSSRVIQSEPRTGSSFSSAW